MTTSTYSFVDGSSGKIVYTGLGYTATTGSANCKIEKNPGAGTETRAFFNFNTSGIPDNAIITLVEFKYVEAGIQPINPPDGYTFMIGTFINGSLDGDAGEFTGGTEVANTAHPILSGTWVGFDVAANSLVNKSGETDVAIWGDYSGGATQGRNFNLPRDKCQLRVTYHVRPQVI